MNPRLGSTHVGADEIEAFRQLQSRLPRIWLAIQDTRPWHHTSVVVPSLSVDQEELSRIHGASFYEERLLFSLMRLRHPTAHVIYVTSQPIHPEIVDYYLQLLVGVPAGHARKRLAMLCVYDATQRPLTEKILERPRVIRRIRDWIGDPERAYLTCYNSSPLERKLALALGVPLNGVDPELLWLGTKSGSRRVFVEAGVPHPPGFEHVRTEEDVVGALLELWARRPGIRRAIVKLNEGFSGEGNAQFAFPDPVPGDEGARRAAIAAALQRMEWTTEEHSYSTYFRKLRENGGIVEERIEAAEVRSPSVQMRINPIGEVNLISSHEQVLGGRSGQIYLGCRFPANDDYRRLIQDEAAKVGRVLSRHGVFSRFGVDFMTFRNPGEPWRCAAVEINLRMGGTTFPFLALEFLTSGKLDAETGLFKSPSGQPKYYFATDNLKSRSYRGLLPDDLIDITVRSGLHFRASTETGVLFYMIGALSQFGKLGVTCIGDNPDEANELYERTVEMLDHETGATGSQHGRPSPLLDDLMPAME
jgi:hypothetical protein